jgi:hypothetical protein
MDVQVCAIKRVHTLILMKYWDRTPGAWLIPIILLVVLSFPPVRELLTFIVHTLMIASSLSDTRLSSFSLDLLGVFG